MNDESTPNDPSITPQKPLHLREENEESRWSWFKEHKLALIISAIVLVVLIAGAFFYPQIITWRAHSLADKSQQYADNKDWKNAFSAARAAYQLRPGDPAVMRCVAKFLSEQAKIVTIYSDEQAQSAFECWQLLLKSPEATLDDRRIFVAAYVGKPAYVSVVDEQLRLLFNQEPNSAKNWLLFAKVSEGNGDAIKMLQSARKAHELDPNDDDITLYLARQLLRFPDFYAEGFTLLWTLVEGNGKDNLEACTLAAQKKDLTENQMDRLVQCLKNSANATVPQKLAALGLEARKHPDKQIELLDAAVKEYRGLGGDALCLFGEWLNQHGASSWTLTAIPPDVAKSNALLFSTYVDALIAQRKWNDLQKAVSEPNIPLKAHQIEVLRAQCAEELGKRDEAILHWRSAQADAVGSPEQEFAVANFVRRYGRTAQAESIYRSLTVNPATALQAYKKLLEMAMTKDTASVRALFSEMIPRWPKDPEVQNGYAYYSVLLGEDLLQNRQTAIQLVNDYPSFLLYRTTLALAWLRLNQPGPALDVYNGSDIKWELAPAHFKAVYAAVLNANDKKEEAKKMAEAIQKEALRPEERELLNF